MNNNPQQRPPVTSEHDRLEQLIAAAIVIKKTMTVILQNTRSSDEGESKASVKSIGRTVQDKLIDLQDTLDEIVQLSNELDAYVGSHQENQKAVQGRVAERSQ